MGSRTTAPGIYHTVKSVSELRKKVLGYELTYGVNPDIELQHGRFMVADSPNDSLVNMINIPADNKEIEVFLVAHRVKWMKTIDGKKWISPQGEFRVMLIK